VGRRLVGRLLGLCLLAAGVLLAVYGLFAILYRGDDGGGNTYVTIAGREMDADLAGTIALLIAFLAFLGGATLFRRRTRRRSS
jgi:hypothetical protein